MANLPPIFIFPTHLQIEDLHEAEDAVDHASGRLSYQPSEARIFLTKVLHKKRAAFDLRARGLWTREAPVSTTESSSKRRKIDGKQHARSRSASETANDDEKRPGHNRQGLSIPHGHGFPDLSDHIAVLKLEWLDACIQNDEILPIEPYLVYFARIIEKPIDEKQPTPVKDAITYIKAIPESQAGATAVTQSHARNTSASSILERAKEEAAEHPSPSESVLFHRRKFGQRTTSRTFGSSPPTPKLYRASTTELEDLDASNLPPAPPWLSEPHPRPMYSCLRSTRTLEQSPNRHFIEQLGKIKEARLLTLDEIGVRAYSTSIASLAAYPHRITSPAEIIRLPGCNEKIASLWIDWHESVTLSDHASPSSDTDADTDAIANDSQTPAPAKTDASLDASRTIPIVNDLTNDKTLSRIRHFHQIWGVGPDTARKFHLSNGWTTLDDIVEFGWHTLNRSQQIGVKFFEDFQLTIPGDEVESIARTVLHHARLCRNIPEHHWTNDVVAPTNTKPDPRDMVAVIVGGYRRGKPSSGDVDVILSHRDERVTQDLVVDVVAFLETAGFITHTLTLHTTTSGREQQTLPYRADGTGGHGFDSLDKALCVWRDPVFDAASAPDGKNPNVHRRVDIIVSAWRTVGCAVLGWSGGTTFQRDIRRWVKREKGWKFDSSGVRDRGTGVVLDLESSETEGEADGWEDRERRLMERIDIGWRPAGERCTG